MNLNSAAIRSNDESSNDNAEPPRVAGPRERALQDGIQSLGDSDLIAILLCTGEKGRPVSIVAAEVLDACAGLEGLKEWGPSALSDISGIGTVKALRIVAAVELGRRIAERGSRPRPPVRCAFDVIAYLKAKLTPLSHEELWVVSLDGRNSLRGCRRVAQGGLHSCSIEARDIFRAAIADAASAVVVAHNHPSGDPLPSREDLAMTRAVISASEVVGIPLVDHIILAPDGTYSSMLAMGLIQH